MVRRLIAYSLSLYIGIAQMGCGDETVPEVTVTEPASNEATQEDKDGIGLPPENSSEANDGFSPFNSGDFDGFADAEKTGIVDPTDDDSDDSSLSSSSNNSGLGSSANDTNVGLGGLPNGSNTSGTNIESGGQMGQTNTDGAANGINNIVQGIGTIVGGNVIGGVIQIVGGSIQAGVSAMPPPEDSESVR